MDKVRVSKRQAALLSRQFKETAVFLGTSEPNTVHLFLIQTALSPQERSDYYRQFFVDIDCDELLSELGMVTTYIDALRKGYEVQVTLEEDFEDRFKERVERYDKELSSYNALTEESEYRYTEGQRDEARNCLLVFEEYLKAKKRRDEDG